MVRKLERRGLGWVLGGGYKELVWRLWVRLTSESQVYLLIILFFKMLTFARKRGSYAFYSASTCF